MLVSIHRKASLYIDFRMNIKKHYIILLLIGIILLTIGITTLLNNNSFETDINSGIASETTQTEPDISYSDIAPSLSTVTAICNDGTYSYSNNCQGTCSHHGGVREWLERGKRMGCG